MHAKSGSQGVSFIIASSHLVLCLSSSVLSEQKRLQAASAQPAAAAKPTLKPLQLRQEGTASPTKGSLQFAAAKVRFFFP